MNYILVADKQEEDNIKSKETKVSISDINISTKSLNLNVSPKKTINKEISFETAMGAISSSFQVDNSLINFS